MELQSQVGLSPANLMFWDKNGGLKFVILDPLKSRMMLLDMGTGTKIDGSNVRDVLTKDIRTLGDVKPRKQTQSSI